MSIQTKGLMSTLSQLTGILGYSFLNMDSWALWDHADYLRHLYGFGFWCGSWRLGDSPQHLNIPLKMYVYSINPGHSQYYQCNPERNSAHCKVDTEDLTPYKHLESSEMS